MKYQNILITGGAGFVGSNLALKLKNDYPDINITCMDNLKRRGSELSIPRFKSLGIEFIHGDIRNREDFTVEKVDLILECSVSIWSYQARIGANNSRVRGYLWSPGNN